ncbi:MAG: hypothetical protein LBL58_02435 [Tannerellaceae bacterium]|jgi:hypothetical protein|nr:hypothetical protein [Tannerellaceae bacterium]
MKKKLFYLLTLFLPIVLLSCNDNDGTEIKNTDEVIITTKAFDTYLHVEFIDAKTGEYLKGQKVTVNVMGTDANAVYNNLGAEGSEYTSEIGMLDLVVDPSKNYSDFILKVSVAGYSDYYQRIRIDEIKFTPIRILMTNLIDLPEGVSKGEQKQITIPVDGKTTENVSINLNTANTINIPKGTMFKDASGNVISGNIESKVLFYDPVKEAALNAFPGGLDIEAVRPDGKTANITFTSAGLFDIELRSGDKIVKTIEGGEIQLTTKLSPSLVNPYTRNPIKVNDEIEMWSMDPATGVWRYEKTAKIKRNTNGELCLQENIDHLSYWNWDWFTNSCSYGSKIKWEGNASGVSVLVKNQHPMNSYSNQITTIVDVNDSYYNNLQFQYVPQNMPTTLTFEGYGADKDNLTFEPAILTIPNLCDGKTYTVKVTEKSNYYYIDLDLKVVSKSNPNIVIKPYAYAYIRPFNGLYYSYYQLSEGILKTRIKAEIDYEICVYLGSYYGIGKLKLQEAGSQVKVTITPEFVYNYDDSSIANADTEDIIVDKPSDNIIKISTVIALSDEDINKIR